MRPSLTLAAALLAAGGATAAAADLQNRDDADYEVVLHGTGSDTYTSIEGSTRQLQVCADCTIEVVGIGEIEVDPTVTVVIIENGELRTE
jgi:hypothetical protein